jgi:hypothetical protein
LPPLPSTPTAAKDFIPRDFAKALASTFAGLQVDTVTPVVTQVVSSPSSGDIGLLRTVAISLGFSKPVTVTGIPVLKLNDGGVAVYTGGSGTSALTFTYLTLPGQNTSDLQVTGISLPLGSSIKDTAGHIANLAGAGADLGLQVDTIIPVVSSVGAPPATGPLNAGKTVAIALKISEPVVVKGAPTLSFSITSWRRARTRPH